MPPHRPAYVVFDEHVEFEPNTGCWLWAGARRGWAYGSIAVQPRQQVSVHRYSYQVHKGTIPEGLMVLHKCDTPACVNPEHLFLGTALDNAQDCSRKGRQRYGPKAPKHPKQVVKLSRQERFTRAVPAMMHLAVETYQNRENPAPNPWRAAYRRRQLAKR